MSQHDPSSCRDIKFLKSMSRHGGSSYRDMRHILVARTVPCRDLGDLHVATRGRQISFCLDFRPTFWPIS